MKTKRVRLGGVYAFHPAFFAQFFSRIFAMALYAYENGIPATVNTIKNEIQQLAAEKPVLAIESTTKN